MYEKELVLEILTQIISSAQTILKRFAPIHSPDDFTDSDGGNEKLDAICMQLIALGESLKKIDKMTDGTLLNNYPEIEWKKVMGIRDIISHHYFEIDAEIIYDVCENYIETLAKTISRIIKGLS